MRIVALFALALFSISLPSTSSAGTILVTSRGALSGSDSLIFSTLGAEGTTLASGATANTVNLNTVTFTDSGIAGFSVLQEGSFWSGNFAAGGSVLWTGNINTLDIDAVPVTLSFAAAVRGVGLQIQPDALGSFTASIDAFDSTNTLIGSFSENGVSSVANDDSAIFIGVASTAADIQKIRINITSPTGLDFAFNDLTFGSVNTDNPIPEPGSLTLILFGAGMLPLALRLRSRKNRS